MKIRIIGTGDKGRSSFISMAYDISDPFWMTIAIKCWKENKPKWDKLDIIDAETGEYPIGDPFEHLSKFHALADFSNKVAGINK